MVKQRNQNNGLNKILPTSLLLLQLEYEKVLGQTTAVVIEESCRSSNVAKLLSEHDRDVFLGRLEDSTSELQSVQARCLNLQKQLQYVQTRLSQLHTVLQFKFRQIKTFKTEANCLEAISATIPGTEADKQCLAREISNMKLRLSQLRVQNNSYQTAISERLALQKRITLLESELQNQRQVLMSAKHNDSGRMGKESNLTAHEILKQKNSMEKLEMRLKTEVDKRTALENEVKELKVRLHIAEGKQSEVEVAPRSHLDNYLGAAREAESQDFMPGPLRRRPQIAIATPGRSKNCQPVKSSSTLPGDKSLFSVTPFLSRTNIDVDTAHIMSEEFKRSPASREGSTPPRLEASVKDANSFENHKPGVQEHMTQRMQGRHDSLDLLAEQTMQNNISVLRLTDKASRFGISEVGRNAVKRRRVLGAKREKALFDLSDGLNNCAEGREAETQTRQFSPLKRRLKPV
ncbi:hypothetical protein D8B26_006895 [Coccidioides posadasii str. Silveira]|uniref:Uncharacterized protein n=3 Tax=Coccidioides posadasii TaxID=199306 RepID=E9DG11_COCPS|nr:hypothetical protein CPC735_000540 [Coccidioides posadasii C735 delta SOWgp]EER24710.1 hypothetical protein CPC735_000540 [Coccidioides posadasii C735 delta SOWgp]EFW14502.1 conserved hypothetical protein [Coccidioides posadasii str. Silveira]KMM68274.1 hypothetical protein CPAG_04605 [Coccidioides posadasii RMSCC 3488]QVM12264.1 hypothetical protein D8B26_006895 [Coccidioides posadasii str. Silveira]|eukprot:XP_003066855.1 hypothetical protein CPC735_000540 [Coccidioides posadasii C735 delta SOWgp]